MKNYLNFNYELKKIDLRILFTNILDFEISLSCFYSSSFLWPIYLNLITLDTVFDVYVCPYIKVTKSSTEYVSDQSVVLST